MINHRLHRFPPQRVADSPRIMAKKKLITQIIILVTGYWLLVTSGYAQSISSTELINNAKQYDGKTVVYEGEVIGDIMVRGDYAWLNVNDGQNAIGIWINTSLVKDIIYTGSYTTKGDRVEISGIFQAACPEHGGDLDIHAQGIKKISPGRKISQRLNLSKRNFAYVLLGLLCIVWILRKFKTR